MTVPYLPRLDGARLAYHTLPGDGPCVMFFGGFRSDMTGTKALYLEAQCRARGQAFMRFDYRGHGASDGAFDACVLSDWRDDALLIFDRLSKGPVILVGSSMGGWLALLVGLARPERVAGLVGIAAAPDFTRWMRDALTEGQRDALRTQGYLDMPSAYSAQPYRISAALLEDGEKNFVLDRPIRLSCPVHLLQGQRDDDVPWQTALKLRDALPDGAALTLIPDGDHRLSRPEDLALIDAAVWGLSEKIK